MRELKRKGTSSEVFARIVPVDSYALQPVVLPENTLCIAALKHIGWSDEGALEIFQSWKAQSKFKQGCDDRDPSLIE
ncbi:hypothetical protein NHQ30_001383 [Ciborinia camelliae]|nr:hypothetical protein NHQ30_001383 [Ciborinia camelliae]